MKPFSAGHGGYIIDIGIKSVDQGYILQDGGLMLLSDGLGVVAAMICQYFAAAVAKRIGRGLRDKTYSHVMALSENDSATFGTDGLIILLPIDVNQVRRPYSPQDLRASSGV